MTTAGIGPSGERRKATEVSSIVLTFHPALGQLGVRWVPIFKVGRQQHPQGHSVHGGGTICSGGRPEARSNLRSCCVSSPFYRQSH